jgi:hypothetical protein
MAKRSAPSTVKRSAPFTDQTIEGFETRWADFIEALSPRERALLEAAGLLGSGTATDASRRQRADLMALFDAGYGINPITLQQVRAMNAGARGELREKRKWINERISEGYTREEARHLYYEWGGEGQELNPNKTLSDEEIDRLYADYLAGNTPNALEEEGSLEPDPDLMGTATVEETIDPEEDFTTAPLPTPTPTDDKVEVDDIGGTELTEVDDTAESTYTLPENEPVDVTKLPTEDQIAIWPQIKEALGGIAESVGKLIFGPKGMPTSVDEWIEWVDETLQAQMGPSNLPYPTLPFPIVITYDSDKGTWLDLKIPVNFDVNGNPIRIPLFDEDGNFVGSEELGEAWTDAKGQIFGPLGEIGEILTDGEGNILVDLKDVGNVLLDDLSINEDGTLTGSSTATVAIGKLFLNPDTGEWEEKEDEPPPETSTEAGETTPETTTDVEETPPPKDLPIVGEDEEETPPPTKGGKVGGRVITDKEGNVVEINRPDVIVGNGGETVLPGTTTVNEPVDNRLDDDIWNRGPGVGTTLEPAEVGEELILEEPVGTGGTVIDEEDDDIWNRGPGVGTTLEPAEVGEELILEDPVVTTQDPVVTTQDPVVTTQDPEVGDPVIVEQGPEDPLVGTADPIVEDPLVGTSSSGGGGGGGGGLGSGGYMGGLSYGLPPFVEVQYQPKDYTAQLNRIINESLFKGMI